MKTRRSLIFVLMLFVTFTNAISKTQIKPGRLDSTIFKKHSLQFRVNSLFSLSSFKGSLFSYKYHSSDKRAYRISVGLYSENYDQKFEHNYTYQDTLDLEQDLWHNKADIFLTFEFLNYLNPEDEVKVFWGIGPRLNVHLDNYDTDNISITDSGDYSYSKKESKDSYEAGITGAFGLEWFFLSNMSLHAEYSFNFSYFYRSYSRHRIAHNTYSDKDRDDESTYTDHGVRFSSDRLAFGLSVYF